MINFGQVKKEADLKMQPLQQREADLIEEVHRQKEKERLRKVNKSIEICCFFNLKPSRFASGVHRGWSPIAADIIFQ